MKCPWLLQGNLHKYGVVVGVGDVTTVVCEAFECLVVEDVVDAHGLFASESAHETTATLFEAVDHVSEHGVIDE